LGSGDWVGGAETEFAASAPLRVASVPVERNVTDNDFEVVFEVKGPQGPWPVHVGNQAFCSLDVAYPQSVYRVSGLTVDGARFASTSTLSHRVAATTTFVNPAGVAQHVPSTGSRFFGTPSKTWLATSSASS